MKRVLRFALILAAVLCVSSLPTWAGVIFNDFGSGYDYNCCSGWTIAGPGSALGEFESGMLFTAGISGTVSQIDLALSQVTGDGGATVSLWTDSGGLPGSMMGSWGVTAVPGFGGCCAVVTINTAAPTLVAGQSYFLVAIADDISWEAWNWNSQGVNGVFVENSGGGWSSFGGETLGAFDILSGGVPEPASMMLLGAGLLFVLMRKRAVR